MKEKETCCESHKGAPRSFEAGRGEKGCDRGWFLLSASQWGWNATLQSLSKESDPSGPGSRHSCWLMSFLGCCATSSFYFITENGGEKNTGPFMTSNETEQATLLSSGHHVCLRYSAAGEW